MDSWFLAAVKGSTGNEKMVADDPFRKFCFGRLKNIPTQAFCVLLVAAQAFLINWTLVTTHEGVGKKWEWFWFVADAVVIGCFIASFFLREWRVKPVAAKHKDTTGFSKGLPFGSLAWLVYAVFLGARVALIFKNDLHQDLEINDLKLTICLTAVVCICFTSGHHHRHESLARRAAILGLVKMFTIDLLDTVDILDVLFITARDNIETFPIALEDIVLAVVTLNLIRPSIVLVSLFVDHFSSHIRSLKVKIFKSLIELLLLNVPLLVIRSYISVRYEDSISVFLVKNILGILYGLAEIYDCCFDLKKSSYDLHDPQDHKDLEEIVISNINGADNKADRLNGNADSKPDNTASTPSEKKHELTI